jgi:hypothetical protein
LWYEWESIQNSYVGKPEVKRLFRRCREEDNINMDLEEIMWEVVYWIYQAQDMTSGGLL